MNLTTKQNFTQQQKQDFAIQILQSYQIRMQHIHEESSKPQAIKYLFLAGLNKLARISHMLKISRCEGLQFHSFEVHAVQLKAIFTHM